MKRVIKSIIKIIIICLITISIYDISFNNKAKTNNEQKKVDEEKELIEIYFLDVGEADSTYIHYKNYNILIDAGNTVDGKLIVNYLKEIGVNHFDIVFATHAHEDHIGGMNWIIYKFPIDKFYMPEHKAKWKSYQNLIKAAKEKQIQIEEPDIDKEIVLDDLIIQVLWIGHDKEDYNENSIVIKMSYKNTSYLMMSDAEENVEKQIINKNIKSNVLKVGHHGSKYATSANFLYKVKPEYAIISVGKENDYNHPHQITLNKLDKINAKIYRTDIDHTIHLISDGDSININTINKQINGGDLN